MVTDYLVEDSNIGFVGLGSVRLSVFAPPLKEYTSRGTSKRPRIVTVRTEPLEDNKEAVVMPRGSVDERSTTEDHAIRSARRALLALTNRLEPLLIQHLVRQPQVAQEMIETIDQARLIQIAINLLISTTEVS